MNFNETRALHSTFRYIGFETELKQKTLEITFQFSISPEIQFSPHILIPVRESVDEHTLATFAFHMGLIEAISYWKSTCSPELIIEAGSLTEEQTRWWHDLFIHGLGEFYFKNNIDFTRSDFLKIIPAKNSPKYNSTNRVNTDGDLILVGGGKDSAVSLELSKQIPTRQNVMLLNPTPAAKKISEVAGYNKPLIIKRTIDQKLLELNQQGYLNGHTPFSAYLSFLGIFMGVLHRYQHVIVSNEASAGEGNILFHGMEINHQYSKSFLYEKLFRDYCRKFLTNDVIYFSLLRPLSELQITALYGESVKYDEFMNSCNAGRGEYWCKDCPKCAFSYLIFRAFMSSDRLQTFFGTDELFNKPQIQKHIEDLVGLGIHKPFDCVGTEDESREAVFLAIDTYKNEKQEVPVFLNKLALKLGGIQRGSRTEILRKMTKSWNQENFLPEIYSRLLSNKLKSLSL